MIKLCPADSRSAEVGGSGGFALPLTLGVLGSILLLAFLGTMAPVSAPEEPNLSADFVSAISVSTIAPSMAAVRITKTVYPNPFYTSEPVSICFTIGRRTLDVVLVQDVSGSMSECLTDSQVIAKDFVSYLQSADRAAFVPLSTTPQLTRSLTTSKSEIIEAIDDLTAGGWTNIGSAISVAHKALITSSPYYLSDTVKAIVLLSDGQANCDKKEHCDKGEDMQAVAAEYVREQAAAAAADKVRIYTIGFNSDSNEELLKEIAEIGHGEYFSAPGGSLVEPIYLTIALEFHDLVITDVLTAGVEADCSLGAPDSCSGGARVVWPVSDSLLITNPLSLCFEATITDLDCGYQGPINEPTESGFCYQDIGGETVCDRFSNPMVTIMCRKAYFPIVANCYSAACSPGIVNGGFEDGWNGWVRGGELSDTITLASTYVHSWESSHTINQTSSHSLTPTHLHWGDYSALLGIHTWDPDPSRYDPDPCNNVGPGSAWIEQTVLVPCTGSPKLSFWYSLWTHARNKTLDNRKDLFKVEINGVRVFADMNQVNNYGCMDPPTVLTKVQTIDLSAYKGECITVRFVTQNEPNRRYNTWTYVDDVEIVP
jgi:hypothetical protein